MNVGIVSVIFPPSPDGTPDYLAVPKDSAQRV